MDSVGIKERDLAVDAVRSWWRTFENTKLVKPYLIFGPFLFILLFYVMFSSEFGILVAFSTLQVSIYFIVVSFWMLVWILKKDVGDEDMLEIANPIKEGAEGFLLTHTKTIFRLAAVFAVGIMLIYLFRSPTSNSLINDHVSSLLICFFVAISFIIGAFCSALSGYAGMWVSVRANVRVAAASRKCYDSSMKICFRGGAFAAIINVALALLGISVLYLVLYFWFWIHMPAGVDVPIQEIPVLLVGFGFGASFVAMFAQLGGGIYTKAADVGADLIGKVEVGIPEDDPRNPAVIADLVGDNVGDCAGQCADLFESISAEILSAMILGGSLADEGHLSQNMKAGFILFPLCIHSLDLVVSTISTFFVKTDKGLPELSKMNKLEDPITIMKRAYYLSLVLAVIGLFFICRNFLYINNLPNAYLCFYGCGLLGLLVSFLILIWTQYYTDYNYRPVQSIAESSKMGHATNIITGLSVGLESTGPPILIISVAVLLSYYLGEYTGIKDENGALIGGLYGTAVATMGMFSTGVFVLSMSGFGPIADNAGGIVEMSNQEPYVREITDRLDAVGNVTKANTKGYSVGSATLACFLLFSAFLDEVTMLTGKPLKSIDITVPEVFIGGLLGSVTVFVFSAWTIAAVGNAAEDVIAEVRRQFREHPGILTYEEKPDNKKWVSIVAQAGQREMIKPGLLALFSPILVGFIFRLIGSYTNRDLLGAEVLAGFLMFSTCTGILMALFFNNAGGAWDNAKKYVELGKFGGKNSDAHKAAVTGDTVGDPCKDTAGPSIHILIKLVSTITLVLVPLFVVT